MKTSAFMFKRICCWLLLPVLLFGVFLPVHPVHAAGPCTTSHLHGGNITSDESWCVDGDATHYLNNDVVVEAGVTLTIKAGVSVDSSAAAWSKYLIVHGHLDINGTAAKPVLLTRSINYPNQNWAGLFFDGSYGDGSGTISYATITHAGSNFLPPGCVGNCGNGQTAVVVKDLAAGKQVTIDHSNFTDNVNKGLYVVDSKVTVSDTTFSQNKHPIWIEGQGSIVTFANNAFNGNAYPYYDNTNYTVQEDSIFFGTNAMMGHSFSLPLQNGLDAYVFPDGARIPVGITMTVEPGVTVRTVNDKYLSVQGRLEAVGTSTLPILFSGIPSSTPGVDLNWGGLFFDGSQGEGGGTIRHAVINQGGCNSLPPECTGTCGSAQTAVFVKDLPASKALTISRSTIQNSLNKSLFLVNSPTAQMDGNLIKGGRIGVYLMSNLTIANLALIDQAYDGLVVDSGYHVDARHLTVAGAGQSGLHVYNGASGLLRNSILSHNALAAWAEGSGTITLNTNLSDANTAFQFGAVTAINTVIGSAAFKPDGYHIQNTSAAISLGIAGLESLDIDGDLRPLPTNTLPDLGADESEAGVFRCYLTLLFR